MSSAALPLASSAAPPSSVRAWIAGARRRWIVARSLEAFLLGAAAGIASVAADVASGGALDRVAFALGAIAASACAATWLVERWRSPAELARRLDRRLGQAGALLTAFELDERASASPLERALAARVRSGLSRAATRAAIPPPSIAFVAAPLLAAALLALVIEQGIGARSFVAIGRRTVASGIARELASQLERSGTRARDPEVARALADAATLISAAAGSQGEREELRAALSEIEQRLRTLASSLAPQDASARDVADARALAAQARLELDPSGPRAASARGGANSGADLTSGPGDRTISGPSSAAGAPASTTAPNADGAPPPSATALPDEAGTLAGRWWPERYDGVVEGWTLARRAALDRHP